MPQYSTPSLKKYVFRRISKICSTKNISLMQTVTQTSRRARLVRFVLGSLPDFNLHSAPKNAVVKTAFAHFQNAVAKDMEHHFAMADDIDCTSRSVLVRCYLRQEFRYSSFCVVIGCNIR